MYLVTWMIGDRIDDPEMEDHYQVFVDDSKKQNLKDAEARYKQLLGSDDVYSVNLCKIIKSSDY